MVNKKEKKIATEQKGIFKSLRVQVQKLMIDPKKFCRRFHSIQVHLVVSGREVQQAKLIHKKVIVALLVDSQ